MNIGDKVLCIDDKNYREYAYRLNILKPQALEVYTIRDFSISGKGILLNEIVNPKYNFIEGLVEPSWLKHRFIKWNPEEEIEFLKEKETLTIEL